MRRSLVCVAAVWVLLTPAASQNSRHEHSLQSDREFSRSMSAAMATMHSRMAEPQQTEDPDRDFLTLMIPHHEGAVEMSKDLQNHDAQAELKQLASDIITAQESEIKQMQQWLGSWQGR